MPDNKFCPLLIVSFFHVPIMFVKTFAIFQPGFEDPNALKTPILRYCAVSCIENSHITPVTDLMWLPDHMQVCSKHDLF